MDSVDWHATDYAIQNFSNAFTLINRATRLSSQNGSFQIVLVLHKILIMRWYSVVHLGYGNMNALKLDNWEQFKDLYARNRHQTSVPLVSHTSLSVFHRNVQIFATKCWHELTFATPF